MESFTIRKLTIEDLPAAVDLSVAEGWNQTVGDWRFLIEDTGNICVAFVADNKLVATTIVVNYADKLGWVSMVLVNKYYRGRGISRLLLQYVIGKYPGALKLDATVLGEPVYRKLDFKNEYLIARMVNARVEEHILPGDDGLKIGANHLSEITALDALSLGAERKKLIDYLASQYPGKAWVLTKGKLEGFVLGRDGYRYHHIGPVVANSVDQAEKLISKAVSSLINKPAVIDVLCDKKILIERLTEKGFVEQRRFIRMYRKQNIFPGNPPLLFAVAGPELG